MTLRPFLLGAAVAVALTLLTVCGLEVGVRLFHAAPPLPVQWADYVTDADVPFKPRPMSVITGATPDGFRFEYRHNAFGLRDTEHTPEKPRGVFRIVGLGDSFAYGAGADFADTFLVQLEAMLNRPPDTRERVEIIKAGVPRFFPEPERQLLERHGLGFHPDLVLVEFHPNDVIDTALGRDAIVVSPEGGYLISRQSLEFGRPLLWLSLYSDIGRLVLSRLAARRAERDAPVRWAEVFREGAMYEPAWRTIEDEYSRIAALAKGAGARCAVVHVPLDDHGDPAHAYPAARLARWGRAHDCTVIDASPALAARRREGGPPLYWPKDGHCTAAGYRVIAEAVRAGLTDARLVP